MLFSILDVIYLQVVTDEISVKQHFQPSLTRDLLHYWESELLYMCLMFLHENFYWVNISAALLSTLYDLE